MKARPFLPNLVAISVLVVMCMIAGAAVAQAAEESSKTWKFDVVLDGKTIGEHTYSIAHSGPQTTVTSDASFDVRFLFVTALKYRHSAVETWQQDCLTGIDAQTISNSKTQIVSGAKDAGKLEVISNSGATTFTQCVKTFAYWNPEILDAQALLNAQTGEYVKVEVTPLGDDVVTVGEHRILAQKYALRSTEDAEGKPVDIVLWYSAATRAWLALESTVSGNRVLRYQPVALPASTPSKDPLRSAAAFRGTIFLEEQW